MQPDSPDLAQHSAPDAGSSSGAAAPPAAYSKPRLECLGAVERVTRANINGNQFDTFGDFRFS